MEILFTVGLTLLAGYMITTSKKIFRKKGKGAPFPFLF